jgi:DNA-binding transcriptional regulator of glucitol operon
MAGPSDQPPPVDQPTTDRPTSTDWRRTWLTPRAIAMHVTLLVVVPTFAGLFWWQVQRVRQGNTLSWAYVFEWPFFAAYAVYMWWKLVHDQAMPAEAERADGGATPETEAVKTGAGASIVTTPTAATAAGTDADRGPVSHQDEDDEEMAAYNRYLAELDASGRRKHW